MDYRSAGLGRVAHFMAECIDRACLKLLAVYIPAEYSTLMHPEATDMYISLITQGVKGIPGMAGPAGLVGPDVSCAA